MDDKCKSGLEANCQEWNKKMKDFENITTGNKVGYIQLIVA